MAVGTPAFQLADTVMVVGGRGTKAGDPDAGGGCSQDYWDASGDLSDIMGVNGECLNVGATWTDCEEGCDIEQYVPCGAYLWVAHTDGFPGVEVGHIVHLKFKNTSVYVGLDDRYLIVEMDGIDRLRVMITWIQNEVEKCDAKVGGAFDKLQTALDETDANDLPAPHNVNILTNKTETFDDAGDEIDTADQGGHRTYNTWKRIIGVDSEGVELEDDEYILIDADGQASRTFDLINPGNISFYHIWAKDATSIQFNIDNTISHYNYLFDHCKGTGGQYGIVSEDTYTRHFSIIGGHYEGSLQAVRLKAVLNALVADAYCYSPGSCVIYVSSYGAMIRDCILESDGTANGVQLGSGCFVAVTGCVFYNVSYAMIVNTVYATLVEYNNIIVVNDKAAGRAISYGSGSIAYSDYSCLWALDGAPEEADRWGGQNRGLHAIEADPLFRNPAGGDYRLAVDSPCLNTGLPTLGGLY